MYPATGRGGPRGSG